MCLPCPLGGSCAGFVNGNYTLPVPTAGWYNMNSTLTNVRAFLPPSLFASCPRGSLVHAAVLWTSWGHCSLLSCACQLCSLRTPRFHVLCCPFCSRPPSMLQPGVSNQTLFDLCPDDRGLLGRKDKTCLVPCEPAAACVGANLCSSGYQDLGPSYRCSSCANNYYRIAGDCVKCPSQGWILILVFLAMAVSSSAPVHCSAPRLHVFVSPYHRTCCRPAPHSPPLFASG